MRDLCEPVLQGAVPGGDSAAERQPHPEWLFGSEAGLRVAQGAGWIFLLFPTRSPQQVNPREARLTMTLPGPRLSRLRRHLDLCPAALEAEH